MYSTFIQLVTRHCDSSVNECDLRTIQTTHLQESLFMRIFKLPYFSPQGHGGRCWGGSLRPGTSQFMFLKDAYSLTLYLIPSVQPENHFYGFLRWSWPCQIIYMNEPGFKKQPGKAHHLLGWKLSHSLCKNGELSSFLINTPCCSSNESSQSSYVGSLIPVLPF